MCWSSILESRLKEGKWFPTDCVAVLSLLSTGGMLDQDLDPDLPTIVWTSAVGMLRTTETGTLLSCVVCRHSCCCIQQRPSHRKRHSRTTCKSQRGACVYCLSAPAPARAACTGGRKKHAQQGQKKYPKACCQHRSVLTVRHQHEQHESNCSCMAGLRSWAR